VFGLWKRIPLLSTYTTKQIRCQLLFSPHLDLQVFLVLRYSRYGRCSELASSKPKYPTSRGPRPRGYRPTFHMSTFIHMAAFAITGIALIYIGWEGRHK